MKPSLLRSKYLTVTSLAEVPDTHSLVQIKHDGHWAELVCTRNQVFMFSRTGTFWGSIQHDNPDLDGHHVFAEYLFGTNWVTNNPEQHHRLAVFDVRHARLSGTTYQDREGLRHSMALALNSLDLLASLLGPCEKPWSFGVPSLKTHQLPGLVEYLKSSDLEGLVFRDPLAKTTESPIYRLKRTYEQDYVVTGVIRGQGKYSDTCGALAIGFYEPNGRKIETAGTVSGLTDAERDLYWSRPNDIMGKPVLIRGNSAFATGLLRHPRFIRVQPELDVTDCIAKPPRECTNYEYDSKLAQRRVS